MKELKRLLLLIFLVTLSGTLIELYLLQHYEGTQQMIPLLCIATTLILMLILLYFKNKIVLGLFKITICLSAFSGFYGAFLHIRTNLEFEQELAPTASQWDLFIESLSGALPVLAPFSMIVLALMGYCYLLIIKNKL